MAKGEKVRSHFYIFPHMGQEEYYRLYAVESLHLVLSLTQGSHSHITDFDTKASKGCQKSIYCLYYSSLRLIIHSTILGQMRAKETRHLNFEL